MKIFRNSPKCDLYSFEGVSSPKLRFLKLYDSEFNYQEGVEYCGYFGVSIERINLVRILIDLRLDGFNCFSEPVCYKDPQLLGWLECLGFAKEYAKTQRMIVSENNKLIPEVPIYYNFDIIGRSEEKAGGVVTVDRLDGHIWTTLEFEEYMYDYNGILI